MHWNEALTPFRICRRWIDTCRSQGWDICRAGGYERDGSNSKQHGSAGRILGRQEPPSLDEREAHAFAVAAKVDPMTYCEGRVMRRAYIGRRQYTPSKTVLRHPAKRSLPNNQPTARAA